jgi:hypothetical protein
MKVVTLTEKEQKMITKLIDKKMKSMHGKFETVESELTEKEIIKHNKKMANLSLLKDNIK